MSIVSLPVSTKISTYKLSFPVTNKRTCVTAHTLGHAKICYRDAGRKNANIHATLVRSAVEHGNIQAIE